MARPENRSEARALSLTLPIETFNYLVLLALLENLAAPKMRWPRTFSFARLMRCMNAASMSSVSRLPTWSSAAEHETYLHRAVLSVAYTEHVGHNLRDCR